MPGFLSLLPLGRRRPSVRDFLGGIVSLLMDIQQTLERMAKDQAAQFDLTQKNTLALAAQADTLRALTDTVSKLGPAAQADLTAVNATLDTLEQTMAAATKAAATTQPPSTPAAPAQTDTAGQFDPAADPAAAA